MTVSTGFWNHSVAAGNALTGVRPLDGSTGSTGGSSSPSGNSATISANDFLTLLVTEMKNQDPTANTDPNTYINQLVGVNSLEQLININQTLTANQVGTSPKSAGSPASDQAAVSAVNRSGNNSTTNARTVADAHPVSHIATGGSAVSHAAIAVRNSGVKVVAGNLSVPEDKPAAHRLAQALSGLR